MSVAKDEQQRMEQLEALVDLVGLSTVLDDLSQICQEKAVHIVDNWQDESLAHVWRLAGYQVQNAQQSTAVRDLP